MNSTAWQRDTFTISTDPDRLQPEVVHAYLTRSYWAKGRSRETMDKALRNSFCFGLYDGDRQIGLARVVTDFTIFAYLCDVYVLEEYRGKGLGKWLMSTVVSCGELSSVYRWVLVTRDAHELYRPLGFHELKTPEIWMEIFRAPEVKKP